MVSGGSFGGESNLSWFREREGKGTSSLNRDTWNVDMPAASRSAENNVAHRADYSADSRW